MSCQSIISSSCKQITASINCIPEIYQGFNYYFEIQLLDKNLFPLDLNSLREIYIGIYDIRNEVFATFLYPLIEVNNSFESFNSLTVGMNDLFNNDIEILQISSIIDNIEVFENKGKIKILLNSKMTNLTLVGALFCEIKLIKGLESNQLKNEIIIIKSLKLGNVLKSKLQNLDNEINSDKFHFIQT